MSSFNHQISFQISSLHQAYIIFHGELASSCQNNFPSNPPRPPHFPLCQTFHWTISRGGLLCLSLSLSFFMSYRTFQRLGWAPFFEFVDVSVFCFSFLCNPGRLKVKGRVSSSDKKIFNFQKSIPGSCKCGSFVWGLEEHPTANGNIITIIYWYILYIDM